jgi:hypothetical protein
MTTKEQSSGPDAAPRAPGEKELEQFATKHYGKLLVQVRKTVFKGSDNFFGHSPEDVLGQAFVGAAAFVKDRPEKVQELLEAGPKAFERYLYTVVSRRARDIFCDLCRFDVKRRHAVSVAAHDLISDSYREQGFELVEKRQMQDQLNRTMRAMLRMIEEGTSVREIMQTLGITSVRQFYKAKATLLEDLGKLSGE